MNFLILGDGAEERAWAVAIAGDPAHRLAAAYPGFDDFPDVPRPRDVDDALAMVGIEALVVGGGRDVRGEWLRRVAALGLPVICLHPPGDDAEAYYQVALSREETGAVVIPDLPLRLHPAIALLKQAINGQEPGVGAFRGVRLEWSTGPATGTIERDLARFVLPRLVDAVRVLVGEVVALTATGDPPGPRPTEGLIVQFRGDENRRTEVRIEKGPLAPLRIAVTGAEGTLTLEAPANLEGPARLIRRTLQGDERVTELESWDPHSAILAVFVEAIARRDREPHPGLLDGTRAMELSEASVRSLRRGRTVDLHYEQISEAGVFKSVMTSIGCVFLLSILVILPVALIGPPLGIPWTIYLAYGIPPALVFFILMQLLRLGLRKPGRER